MRPLLIAMALLVAGGAHAASWQALVSPAPLSPGHAAMEGRCDACHLVFSGVPNGKCLDCHAWVATKQKSGGFHAGVAAQSCQTCHVDHQGAKGAHTKGDALAAFDHGKTKFQLQGAHKGPKCAACHSPVPKLPGMVAKIGPSSSCADCHADAHKGQLGPSCTSCHAATTWTDRMKTVAEHQIKTDGGHAGLSCVGCHAGGRALTKPIECATCHKSEDAHGGTGVSCESCHQVAAWKPASHDHSNCTCKFPGKHRTVDCIDCHKGMDFANVPTLCSKCHDHQRTHEPLGECSRCHSATTWKSNRFDHNAPKSVFLVELKHLEVSCSQCHAQQDAQGRVQFRAADPDCRTCHQATGDAAHGDFGRCDKCHTTAGFDQTSFDHARDTGVPLTGKHGKVKCQDCHAERTKGYPRPGGKTTGIDRARRDAVLATWTTRARHAPAWSVARTRAATTTFASTTRFAQAAPTAPATTPHGDESGMACVHCHADPHAGQVGTSCAQCHTSQQWTPSTFDLPRHGATRFALDGKHAGAKCASCHVDGKLAGLPIECAGCHVDRHRGKLGPDCKACHTTSAFLPSVGVFDHLRTGFAINKQHAAVTCVQCHGAQREKDLTTVGGPLDCKSCHQSGHATFALDCASCHRPDDASMARASGARFLDHRKTGFALERAHQAISCKSCHVAGKPAAIARCQSCHADPHAGQAGIECRDCHRPDRFSLIRFDHDRTTFALRGRHFMTSCRSCHVNQSFVGARTECFDCHAKDAGRARAAKGGHAFGTTDCRDCHRSTWRW